MCMGENIMCAPKAQRLCDLRLPVMQIMHISSINHWSKVKTNLHKFRANTKIHRSIFSSSSLLHFGGFIVLTASCFTVMIIILSRPVL